MSAVDVTTCVRLLFDFSHLCFIFLKYCSSVIVIYGIWFSSETRYLSPLCCDPQVFIIFCFICKLSSLPSQIKAVEGSFGDNEICVLRDRDVSKHQNWPQFHYLFIVHTLKTPNVVFRGRTSKSVSVLSWVNHCPSFVL